MSLKLWFKEKYNKLYDRLELIKAEQDIKLAAGGMLAKQEAAAAIERGRMAREKWEEWKKKKNK